MRPADPPDYTDRVDALAVLWAHWADLGAGLTEAEWLRPTRCTGWDIRALYAHHSMLPMVLATAPPLPAATGVAPLTAAEVLVRFNQPQGLAHSESDTIAASAAATAAVDTEELLHRFRAHGESAAAALRTADPHLVVPWVTPDTPIAIHELVRIVLMEATVHLLDVYDGLQRPCDVGDGILEHTVRLLAEMVPPVTFIEAATGRSAHSPLPVLR
jgi:uncharacterized protein (TIGR03083 family)